MLITQSKQIIQTIKLSDMHLFADNGYMGSDGDLVESANARCYQMGMSDVRKIVIDLNNAATSILFVIKDKDFRVFHRATTPVGATHYEYDYLNVNGLILDDSYTGYFNFYSYPSDTYYDRVTFSFPENKIKDLREKLSSEMLIKGITNVGEFNTGY